MVSVFKSVMIPPFSWCFSNKADESYAVVSEYYGRGLFNKVTLITESMQESPPPSVSGSALGAGPAPPTYGPGAEAKLRQAEGQSKQVFVPNTPKQVPPKGTTVVPISEGRMRVQEQTRYSSSLEANMKKLEPIHAKTNYHYSPMPSRKEFAISQSITTARTKKAGPVNPFGEDNYDEAKNPFADEEADDPKNPFNDDDDYDKNLNPFS